MIPWCYFASSPPSTSHTQHSAFSTVHAIPLSIIVASNRFHSIQFAIQWKLSFYRQPIPFFLFRLSCYTRHSIANGFMLYLMLFVECECIYCIGISFISFLLSFPPRTCRSFFYERLRLTIDFWHAHTFFHRRMFIFGIQYVEGFIGIVIGRGVDFSDMRREMWKRLCNLPWSFLKVLTMILMRIMWKLYELFKNGMNVLFKL